MVHRHIPEFLALMKHPSIVAEVRRELGGCDGLGSEFFFMPPGMRGMEQHQDNWFLRADSALSVWIALQDVDRQNGAMYVYPSSHERGLLEHNVEGARSRTLEFDGVRDVLAMKAGDALLIHPLTVHGSCDNASNRFRMSVVMTYIADGSDFRPGPKQNRTRVAL
jgi:phytanoyl-CoA hydroxylase